MSGLAWLRSRLVLPRRGWLVFGHDVVMAAASFVLALGLRVGSGLFDYYPPEILIPATAVFTLIAAVAFLATGLYRGVWRYASLADMAAVARATTLTVLVFVLVMFTWTRLEALPRSVPFINWLVLMALLGGPRFLYRGAKDKRMVRRHAGEAGRKIPVLLAGAGHETAMFIQALRQDRRGLYVPVGIVAEKEKRVGQEIHAVPVLGTFEDIPEAVASLRQRGTPPSRMIVTAHDLDGARLRKMIDVADGLGLTTTRLPRLTEFRPGVEAASDLRPVALEDLLGRPQTPLDREAMRAMVAGRRVLVTGAGGSIGSELVRQVAAGGPSRLVLVEQSEFNLYTIEQELTAAHPRLSCPAVIADVRDRERTAAVFASHAPDIVFHAAALKHVPLVEANPAEGVQTNVFGTINVADACVAHGVEAMVMISTDKAVNPSSIMGATKRIAERYCQGLDLMPATRTRFVTVRFGNVLGSTGSVVPLFQRQLAIGGPLTVTHPEMRRYFMSVREAVELILQAAALGRQSLGDGRIYVLDMGEPVRILDLARQMIRLTGLRPGIDIDIVFTGLRPGEKLFEELFGDAEDLVPTDCPGLRLAAPEAADPDRFRAELAALEAACGEGDEGRMRVAIRRLVPEYAGGEPPVRRAAAG